MTAVVIYIALQVRSLRAKDATGLSNSMKKQAVAVFGVSILSAMLLHAAPAWTWRAPVPQGNNLNGAAYSPTNDTVVAVGNFGSIVSKTGNGTWSFKTLDLNNDLSDITWTGSLFVALSYGGFQYSTDGSTWTAGPQNETVKGAAFLASSANRTVALGRFGNTAWVAADAERKVWTKKTLPAPPKIFNGSADKTGFAGPYNALASDGSNTFVAVGYGGTISVSTDGGNTWNKVPSNTSRELQSVASNGSGFVAVSSEDILTSSNGTSWSPGSAQLNDPNPRTISLTRVVAHDGGYLGAAWGGEFFTSTNGTTWKSIGSPLFGSETDSGDVLLASAHDSGGGNGTVVTGYGGVLGTLTGETVQTALTGYFGGSYFNRYASAAGVNGLFVAVDVNGPPRLITSTDGVSFDTPSLTSPLSEFTLVRRIGNALVALAGSGGNFYSTTNGTTWESIGSSTTITGEVKAFAAGTLSGPALAFSEEQTGPLIPRLYRSDDWTTWSQVTLPAGALVPQNNEWSRFSPDLQWDGSKFLLLTPSGKIYTSANGTIWTKLPELPADTAAFVTANYWNGILPGNPVASFASNGSVIVARTGKFDKFGYAYNTGPDRFFVFSNGQWKQQGPVERSFASESSVVWNGAIFASTNGNGLVVTSPDGINWTRRQVGSSLKNLVWTGSQFVGVTNTFGILTHPDGISPRADAAYTDLLPWSKDLTSAGGNYTIAVDSNEAWKVTSSLPWVKVSALSGNFSGNVTVSVQANTTPLARSGIIIIGKRLHTINQAPFISISSPSRTVGYNSGLSYTINATSALPWKVTNPAKWVSVTPTGASANGTVSPGNSTVTFNIQPNTTNLARSVVVSLGGVPHTIIQEAAPRTVVGNTGTFTIPVTSKSEWTASSDSPWAQLSKAAGTGAGSVVVTLPENPTSTDRTAVLTIEGLNYVVIQKGQTLPLLHKGTYTGIFFTGPQPPLAGEGNATSVFTPINDALGSVTVTVTPTTTGGATYTGSLITDGVVYTGKGNVTSSTLPWTISGNWTTTSKMPGFPSQGAVSLNFVVDSPNTKLVRGTVDNGSGIYGILAGKSVFDGKSMLFQNAGNFVSIMGFAWPAAVSVSISSAGVASFSGKFVDGTPLTMTTPVFGSTGVDGEWALLFYGPIYGKKGRLLGLYSETPDPLIANTIISSGFSTAWVPAGDQVPPTDLTGTLGDDHNMFTLSRYIKPAANQPAIIWPNWNATTSHGSLKIPSITPYPDSISGTVKLINKTNVLSWETLFAPNTNKLAFTFTPATGLLEGSFTIPTINKVVKFFGVANQDLANGRGNDNFHGIFLTPAKSAANPAESQVGEVGLFDITP